MYYSHFLASVNPSFWLLLVCLVQNLSKGYLKKLAAQGYTSGRTKGLKKNQTLSTSGLGTTTTKAIFLKGYTLSFSRARVPFSFLT